MVNVYIEPESSGLYHRIECLYSVFAFHVCVVVHLRKGVRLRGAKEVTDVQSLVSAHQDIEVNVGTRNDW